MESSPNGAQVEKLLIAKANMSLHFALQVYWFCQGLIDEHDESPGPRNFRRFLKAQREVRAPSVRRHGPWRMCPTE